MTDDQNNPQVPVLVEARIEADLIVTDLQFGVMAPGQTKQVNVVIRGKKPFKIEEIYRQTKPGSKLAEDAFKVTLSKSTATFHNLPIKFTAADPVGAFEEEFFVKIADRPQPLSFKARGRVTEQTGAAKQ